MLLTRRVMIDRIRHHKGDKPCHLYVMTFSIDGSVLAKVGVSANPRSRVKSVQTGCPFRIMGIYSSVMRSREVAEAAEHHAHDLLSRNNTNGEWFRFAACGVEALFAGVEKAASKFNGGPLVRLSVMSQVHWGVEDRGQSPLAGQER